MLDLIVAPLSLLAMLLIAKPQSRVTNTVACPPRNERIQAADCRLYEIETGGSST
jgi:hypothetical protein